MATVVDRQTAVPRAKAACKRAVEAVVKERPVVVALVDDATIAELHERFLGVAGPTDVLSFPPGEIVVSGDTARREAGARGVKPLHELVLYVVHGALHLEGYQDRTREDRDRMRAAERRILRQLGLSDVFAAHPRARPVRRRGRRAAHRER